MITIIFGAPGTGKTSLNTHFLQTEYKTHGRALLAQTQKRIAGGQPNARQAACPAR